MARKGFQGREELDERVVQIARVVKVMKGGRHFSFRAVVVVGDHQGRVGMGIGKARGVPDAINKAKERAKRNMKRIHMVGSTIPHEVLSKFKGAKVLLKPASPGTGVVAGGSVRAVVEAAGIEDILSKSLGNTNPLNVSKATLRGLLQLKDIQEEAQRRGLPVERVTPFWMRGGTG
ncbi:MAG: 30S ribosomal protein S5 [Chloroflexota bacterium]|nr:30S ribosomal protein S5 [Chloroflexota bacterium]